MTLPAPDAAPPPPPIRTGLPASGPHTTAWRRAVTPRAALVTPTRVVLAGLALVIPLGLLPWQQSAPGAGSVIAFDPAARPQVVEAPVTGRVLAWNVREGQRVEAGDVLVEIQDNDPDLVERLLTERHLLVARLAASEARVEAVEARRLATREAREAQLAAADAKVRAADDALRAEQEVLAAAEASASTALVQAERADALMGEGLRSQQSTEDYRLKADTTRAKREEARAKVAAAEAKRDEARGERDKLMREADGKVAAVDGDLQVAVASARDDEAKILKLDTQLARQDRRLVEAPFDGFIVEVLGGQGGEQVKEQDDLLVLVPDTDDRAVEIWLDGNDAALVREGQEVRLQFEGWPALQFAGWPSVAVGTFGGLVRFVSPADDGKGRFRVLVAQDPAQPAWPGAPWLRQGVRTKGWIMLGTVTLAYEAWRQLNDFPPVVPAPEEKGLGGPAEVDAAGKAGKAWRPK